MQDPTPDPTQEIHSSEEETEAPKKKRSRIEEPQDENTPDGPQQARGSREPPPRTTTQTGWHMHK
eukprot:287048-Prorocentrum_lima.AAC.1